MAIGPAVDIQVNGQVTFPLALALSYDPAEVAAKGVLPELLRVFYFDPQRGIWSTDGLSVQRIDRDAALVHFETTHLTVFRLGVSRGAPPRLVSQPSPLAPNARLTMFGSGFNAIPSQTLLTLGGAYVTVASDPDGAPRALDWSPGGDTVRLLSEEGEELDQATLGPAPAERSAWVRTLEAPGAPFALHTAVQTGKLFSPGARVNGQPFESRPGGTPRKPQAGELFINEVLLSPPNSYLGDVNGDGETTPLGDQFIELVNSADHPLDLSGCRLVTAGGERHRFPDGAVVPARNAMVIFGVDDPAQPAIPAGPFGGQPFQPDEASPSRLRARVPSDAKIGTQFLVSASLRQTSNPATMQVLAPLGQPPTFEVAAGKFPDLSGRNPRFLRSADLDRDLDVDVVAVDVHHEPAIFLNDGAGQFREATGAIQLPSGRDRVFGLAVADLTQDGAPELIIGDTDAAGSYIQLIALRNSGGGRYTPLSTTGVLSSLASVGPRVLEAGDLDGDGDLDVVVGMAGDGPLLFRNDGTHHLTHDPGADRVSQSQPVTPTQLRLADVDGDGDQDLLLAAGQPGLGGFSALQLFVNDGAGRFTDATGSHVPRVGDGIETLAVGDADGDGDVDVATGGKAGGARLFLNDGRGDLQDAAGPIDPSETRALAFEDLDGDGDPDLIMAHPPRDTVLMNNGAGVFQPQPDLPTVPGNHRELLAVDVDNDGDLDVVEAGGSALHLLINAGTRTNHPPTLSPLEPQPVFEAQELIVEVTAQDPDGDPVTLSAALGSGAPLGSIGAALTDHGDGTATFRWTPQAGQGSLQGRAYTIRVTARDGSAGATALLIVTVRSLNHAPSLDPFRPVAIDELAPLLLDLGANAHDVDPGDSLTFGARDLPSGALVDTPTGRLTWTPGPTAGDGLTGSRDYDVTVIVTDAAGASDQEHLIITVRNVNHPPVWVPVPPRIVPAGSPLDIELVATDPDGDRLTLTVLEKPDGSTFDPLAHRWRWTPTVAQIRADPYHAKFQASDGALAATLEIEVTVIPSSGPVLDPIPDQTVGEGEFLEVVIPASGDPNTLTVSVDPLPAGARVVHQGARWLLQWMPDRRQRGTYRLTAQASEGSETATAGFTVTVENRPGFQQVSARVGFMSGDATPAQLGVGFSETVAMTSVRPGDSVGLDLGEVHPAVVTMIELFHAGPSPPLAEGDLTLWVSADNVTYQPYAGSFAVAVEANRVLLAGVQIAERFIKLHRVSPGSGAAPIRNFLPQLARVSGAIPMEGAAGAFLDAAGREAFLYFSENVTANGLIPDRVAVSGDQVFPGQVYSTAATGVWLAVLPIAAERGWLTRTQAEALARRTLTFYLGQAGGPVAGQFGFFYHFVNADGSRFTGFAGDDGVSIIDSTILFLGAIACGESFDGEIKTLAAQLVDGADWNAIYDRSQHLLPLFWTPEDGFIRSLDYFSEGTLAYLLAAGSTTHPIPPDAVVPAGGGDAYYAFSRGSFGRVLGRYGREGRPLLQSFFGSLFTYLYAPLLVESEGAQDAFNTDVSENSREAVLANYRFAQDHPEFGYSRLNWGISASDGPSGYQGRYGTPPLDPGAGGEIHDGTVAPYALAGSLAFAADLALPALQDLAAFDHGRLLGRYSFLDAINVQRGFVATDYLGLDQGMLILGLEQYRSGLIAGLVRGSAMMQRGLEAIGVRTAGGSMLEEAAPRDAHTYLLVDTTDRLTQTIQIAGPVSGPAGECLLELHPFGIDTATGDQMVDVDLSVNGQFIKTLRFLDRRGDGVVDVANVYVPLDAERFDRAVNEVRLTWAGGERWVQLEDVELQRPTGRMGSQETWRIGQRDGSSLEFADERMVDDSYVVGDDLKTLERALNVVDEPQTDLLCELSDVTADGRLRLVVTQTQDDRPVAVEVSVNQAVAGRMTLKSGKEGSVDIPRALLRQGWNHIALRHADVPGHGDFILWDAIELERQELAGTLQALARNVTDHAIAPGVQFGLAPPQGGVISAKHYVEIQATPGPAFDRLTIATDNRQMPVHRYTGSASSSAAGLVGETDSTVVAPLLWQVYDERQPLPPAFTNTTEWAFVPDASEPDFATAGAVSYRTLLRGTTLGDRPSPGRSGTAPIVVYLAADFTGTPAQRYGIDQLIIELFEQ